MRQPLQVDLPPARLDKREDIVHVGPREPSTDRPWGSYEAWHLSVSQDAETWRRIAKLGGRPHWAMTRADRLPGQFVDMLSLTDAQEGVLLASVPDLVVPRQVYRCTTEIDEERVEYLGTSIRKCLNMFPDGEIERVPGWRPTLKLRRAWRKHFTSRLEPRDTHTVALLIAIERLGTWDGAWWFEEDDGYYSAPRGCIFRSRLPRWTWTNVTPRQRGRA